jgi:MerR family copper efflux transcriptional regulator
MTRSGLLIGQLAAKAGVSRKALRLYEEAGILRPPTRTPAGYRVYGGDAVDVIRFVQAAQHSGFTLADIKEVVALRRSGQCPCDHVRELARAKIADVERRLTELTMIRANLARILARRPRTRITGAVICPHVEQVTTRPERRTNGWTPRDSHCAPNARSAQKLRLAERRSASVKRGTSPS